MVLGAVLFSAFLETKIPAADVAAQNIRHVDADVEKAVCHLVPLIQVVKNLTSTSILMITEHLLFLYTGNISCIANTI